MRNYSVRDWIEQNKYLIFVIYYTLYMVGFVLVENRTPAHLYVIHCPLDQYIPFLEIFVIPYILWFFYIGGIVLWMGIFDRDNMCRLLWSGMVGMTIFLLISWFLPNGLDLRPTAFERDNIFVWITRTFIYGSDTPTNVFPSIHVNNSICACVAVLASDRLKDRKVVRGASVIMAGLIVLSTMFLKQHSVVDVSAGMITAWLSCEICFADALKTWKESLFYPTGRGSLSYQPAVRGPIKKNYPKVSH